MRIRFTRYARRAKSCYLSLVFLVVGNAVTCSLWSVWRVWGASGGAECSVDAKGVVQNANIEKIARTCEPVCSRKLKKGGGGPNQPLRLRMVSLKGLEAAIADAHKNKVPTSERSDLFGGLAAG